MEARSPSNNRVTMLLPFTFIGGVKVKTQNEANESVRQDETWPVDSDSGDCCQPLPTAGSLYNWIGTAFASLQGDCYAS